MNNNQNINWMGIVAVFSPYEGTLVNFCNTNHISKNQLYYIKKKLSQRTNNRLVEFIITNCTINIR